MLGVALALATAIIWGANPLFARRAMIKTDVITTNFYGIIVGLLVVTAYSFFAGDLAVLPELRSDQILTFVAVGISTIALGRTAYYISIKRIGAGPSISIMSTSILVAPTIAFVWLQEAISLKMAIGVLMVFAGVFFIARRDV